MQGSEGITAVAFNGVATCEGSCKRRSAFSLAAVLQLPGEEEDGLLSHVGPGTRLSFPVLFQGDVPVPVPVFEGQVGVVVVLLQRLQEVTLLCDRGLRGTGCGLWVGLL